MVLLGMDLGPHWSFIVVAYAVMILVVSGLVAWVMIDHRIQLRTLDELQARGLRRRSNRGGERA